MASNCTDVRIEQDPARLQPAVVIVPPPSREINVNIVAGASFQGDIGCFGQVKYVFNGDTSSFITIDNWGQTTQVLFAASTKLITPFMTFSENACKMNRALAAQTYQNAPTQNSAEKKFNF